MVTLNGHLEQVNEIMRKYNERAIRIGDGYEDILDRMARVILSLNARLSPSISLDISQLDISQIVDLSGTILPGQTSCSKHPLYDK